tara:strand:- start:75 stop:362 length:288 start_codon:yes stop_codon:yes gene_type:complete
LNVKSGKKTNASSNSTAAITTNVQPPIIRIVSSMSRLGQHHQQAVAPAAKAKAKAEAKLQVQAWAEGEKVVVVVEEEGEKEEEEEPDHSVAIIAM